MIFFFILLFIFLVRDDVLIKSIWIKKRKSPLTIPCQNHFASAYNPGEMST